MSTPKLPPAGWVSDVLGLPAFWSLDASGNPTWQTPDGSAFVIALGGGCVSLTCRAGSQRFVEAARIAELYSLLLSGWEFVSGTELRSPGGRLVRDTGAFWDASDSNGGPVYQAVLPAMRFVTASERPNEEKEADR